MSGVFQCFQWCFFIVVGRPIKQSHASQFFINRGVRAGIARRRVSATILLAVSGVHRVTCCGPGTSVKSPWRDVDTERARRICFCCFEQRTKRTVRQIILTKMFINPNGKCVFSFSKYPSLPSEINSLEYTHDTTSPELVHKLTALLQPIMLQVQCYQ